MKEEIGLRMTTKLPFTVNGDNIGEKQTEINLSGKEIKRLP